jgi:NAD(P)-dependent dehydrogenase (short-subunit alcohol dehydrogenase family)
MSEHGSGLPLFNDLAGRRAIVTGGAHGIGEAIVLRLAEQGVEVLVVDKDQQALAARVVGRKGCVPIEADLAAGNPAILVETLCADFGTPDIIVNNVGISTEEGYLDLEEDNFDLVMRCNLRGPWFFTKRLVQEMITEGVGGSILFISSLHDTFVFGRPHYSASKAAVWMLTKELARLLGPYRIRVNAISPGGIATGASPDDLSRPGLPLGRVGLPDDVARMAIVLLSERCADYVTGVNLLVDGGAALCDIWGSPRDDAWPS